MILYYVKTMAHCLISTFGPGGKLLRKINDVNDTSVDCLLCFCHGKVGEVGS